MNDQAIRDNTDMLGLTLLLSTAERCAFRHDAPKFSGNWVESSLACREMATEGYQNAQNDIFAFCSQHACTIRGRHQVELNDPNHVAGNWPEGGHWFELPQAKLVRRFNAILRREILA